MKELTIKRLINTGNYENVEFTATFERTKAVLGKTFEEPPNDLIKRAFEEFGLILHRAQINDTRVRWNPLVITKVTKDIADKIDEVLENE